VDEDQKDAPKGSHIDLPFGLDEIFRGLSSLHAAYGVSVRVGGHRAPVMGRVRSPRVYPRPAGAGWSEPPIDVFDEDDFYLVVAELPGVTRSDLQWNVKNDRLLVLDATAGSRRYHAEVELNAPVDVQTAKTSFENGVLELRLWKQLPR
jgi:HSP20 family protein